MEFSFQLPEKSNLLDEVNKKAENFQTGGGYFAFASRRGIEAFFSSSSLKKQLEAEMRFRLVIGMDAITNTGAILYLEELSTRYRGLQVSAFLHKRQTIFHPKFVWFENKNGLSVIAGSGNLTLGGLGGIHDRATRGNWEAFISTTLHGDDSLNFTKSIDAWERAQVKDDSLLPLSDFRVRDRAISNGQQRVRLSTGEVVRGSTFVVPEEDYQSQPGANLVLVRELPFNRPGQADITADGLSFFGFSGEATTALLQYVDPQNRNSPPSERSLFVNASKNYRIEIPEITQKKYTPGKDDGRVVLVAVRVDDRAFKYTLVWPDQDQYPTISKLLGPIPKGKSRRMRTLITKISVIQNAWPQAPSNLFPIVSALSTR